MYHCLLQFYLTGPSSALWDTARSMPALDGFQHAFTESREPQAGYILIHTTDGEAWGFCGDMEIISDGTDGGDIEIEMSGWLVGSTHDCYNPDPEE